MRQGHAADVTSMGQCFIATASPTDPGRHRTTVRGGAIGGSNPATNKPGDLPEQTRLVACSRGGVRVGRDLIVPDGRHFGFRREPVGP